MSQRMDWDLVVGKRGRGEQLNGGKPIQFPVRNPLELNGLVFAHPGPLPSRCVVPTGISSPWPVFVHGGS